MYIASKEMRQNCIVSIAKKENTFNYYLPRVMFF